MDNIVQSRMRPIGVTTKLMAVTNDFLENQGRRYFGIAAASLHNQLNDPKYEEFKPNSKLINLGITGEKKTSKILREWIKDKSDCVLIDSISLPLGETFEPEVDGEEGQLDLGDTDHLLIIGSTLIIIDSKNWKAKTNYKFSEDGAILRNNKQFPGNRPRINQAKYIWQKYYSDCEIDNVLAYVCISDPNPFITRDKLWWRQGYKLVNQDTLIHFLDKEYTKLQDDEKNGYIRTELVALALKGLVKPYDKMKEKFGYLYGIVNKGIKKVN